MASQQSGSTPPPAPSNATVLSGGGGREGKLHEITDEEEKRKTERRLFSGKYKNITKMATDINGGQPSKAIEEIIFKNMMKIMVNEFNK